MKLKRLFKALMLTILTVIVIIMIGILAVATCAMLSKVIPLSTLNDISMILLSIVMPFVLIVVAYYKCIN